MTPPKQVRPLSPAAAPGPRRFSLRCDDAHPVPCDVAWSGSTAAELVAVASAHGANAHGFTPAWYSPMRVAAMTVAVTA